MATAAPTRVAPPPPPIRKGQVVAAEALHSYTAQRNNELSIEEGDLIFILDQTDKNWWKAKLDDKEGFVPSNYVSHDSARVPTVEEARRGNLAMVERHLSCGVSCNALDRGGNSALHAACLGGHMAVVRCLLGAPGVQLDLQNKLGDTPLHCAAVRGHPLVVEALLAAGGRTDIVNRDGQTPRSLARSAEVVGVLDAHRPTRPNSRPVSYGGEEYGEEGDSD